jgi:hypothetical protein
MRRRSLIIMITSSPVLIIIARARRSRCQAALPMRGPFLVIIATSPSSSVLIIIMRARRSRCQAALPMRRPFLTIIATSPFAPLIIIRVIRQARWSRRPPARRPRLARLAGTAQGRDASRRLGMPGRRASLLAAMPSRPRAGFAVLPRVLLAANARAISASPAHAAGDGARMKRRLTLLLLLLCRSPATCRLAVCLLLPRLLLLMDRLMTTVRAPKCELGRRRAMLLFAQARLPSVSLLLNSLHVRLV